MFAIKIDNISHSYGKGRKKAEVLSNINFSVEEGQVFGLIGLNGMGKTTLIKIMLDIITSYEGEISIFGESSKNISSRINLAYLPEKFMPSKYLKGHEYLSLSMSYYEGMKYDKDSAMKEAERLALDPDALSRLTGSYSKGMGQKLGLIASILSDRKLLILDEPMSGLDPRARHLLKEKIIELKNQGKTVFFSSHILSDIDEICDHIAVIHENNIAFTGTPQSLKLKHNNDSLEKAFLNCIDQTEKHEEEAA